MKIQIKAHTDGFVERNSHGFSILIISQFWKINANFQKLLILIFKMNAQIAFHFEFIHVNNNEWAIFHGAFDLFIVEIMLILWIKFNFIVRNYLLAKSQFNNQYRNNQCQ